MTSTKLTSTVRTVAKAAATYDGEQFTAADLAHHFGLSYYAVNAAVAGGYLRRTAKVKRTGDRGRPGIVLAITAKGRKAAAK